MGSAAPWPSGATPFVFFERDVAYYANHRDLQDLPRGRLILYDDWQAVRRVAQRHLDEADVGIVTSYCPDGVIAAETAADSQSEAASVL